MTTYGPRTRSDSIYWSGSSNRKYARTATWYVQKPITDAPLPYSLDVWHCVQAKTNENANGDIVDDVSVNAVNAGAAYNVQSAWGGSSNPATLAHTRSIQRAYGKLKDAIYDNSAQFGVNIAEYGQAIDLIAKPAIQLRKAWQSLRAGRLDKFRLILGIEQRGKYITVGGKTYYDKTLPNRSLKYSAPKMASNLWLYYHFGWEPLIQDIYAGVKILEDPFPPKLVKARGSSSTDEHQVAALTKDGNLRYGFDRVYTGRTHFQARVLVSNKNLHRATALGLVNPMSVAWELVPFSFVVDWFIPVGQFLDSWTDFSGLTFTDTFTTRSISYKATESSRQWWAARYRFTSKDSTHQGIRLQRSLGLTSLPYPVPKAFKGFSVVRGATAIALLVGALRG